MSGPVYFHAPRFGTLTITSRDDLLYRFDSARPIETTLLEMKVGEVPQREGDYLLLEGRYSAHIDFAVESPRLLRISKRAPASVRRAADRCGVTAVGCFRADTATFSNNGNSIHAVLCMDVWSALSTRMKPVPGLAPLELLRATLERWLYDAPAYGSGATSAGRHRLDDEYLMSGSNPLLGLAEYLLVADAGEARRWLARHESRISLALARVAKQDLDGDGLIESRHRTGRSGRNEWGTNWFDLVSFGWKDAFVNANLYSALIALTGALARLGATERFVRTDEWVNRLRDAYRPTFFNPETGWLAGWRCMEDQLHDYAFLPANGAAVTAGLLNHTEARMVIECLWAELRARGFSDFRLGLPVNVWSIDDADVVHWQKGLPLGSYENGGATHSQARHFVNAMYRVGLVEEADEVVEQLAESLANGDVLGGCGSGVDWRSWDGTPCGYEGQLTDQFGILATFIDRYGHPPRALRPPSDPSLR
jgi:hypothetical protein